MEGCNYWVEGGQPRGLIPPWLPCVDHELGEDLAIVLVAFDENDAADLSVGGRRDRRIWSRRGLDA